MASVIDTSLFYADHFICQSYNVIRKKYLKGYYYPSVYKFVQLQNKKKRSYSFIKICKLRKLLPLDIRNALLNTERYL